MDLNIPELSELSREISEMKQRLNSDNNQLNRQWYNAYECFALKGGCALNTYKTNRYFQPKGGIADARVGGRKVWSRETVKEWLTVTDDELPAYHEKYKTGAKRTPGA